MDTRSKIVPAEEAARAIAQWCAAGEDPALITGFFDPLLPEHAQRIQEAAQGRKVIIAIRDPEKPILSARARAELVAALREVTLVVVPEDESWPEASISFEAPDRTAQDSFVRYVHRRNGA